MKNNKYTSLQPVSLDTWARKYKLTGRDSKDIDKTPEDSLKRVAKGLAASEKDPIKWEKAFLDTLQYAIPGGRIISNTLAGEFKPSTSLINCTVSGTIEDSMRSILEKSLEAGMTLKNGCGIGYEFSTLRPKGAYVGGAGSYTSGPMSFMDIYDKVCFTVSSAGGRRGAQMGTFDISHPDIFDFIRSKREDGRLRQFNLSCLITNEFMDAVKNGEQWKLIFPLSKKDTGKKEVVYKNAPHLKGDDLIRNKKGEVAFKVYDTVPAVKLWDAIMTSNYDYAEPGFLLIDHINDMNNNWFCEDIRATNPCGEQPLPPFGSCLLGSVNLASLVINPCQENSRFNWVKYRKVVRVFTRMLDNVVEMNGLPLEEQRHEILSKRRHGMGYTGLGTALNMMGISYGSKKAIEFTEKVSFELAKQGLLEGVKLADEKGMAPALKKEYTITQCMMQKRPEMAADGIKVGQSVPGYILWAKYSNYLKKFKNTEPDLYNILSKKGCRFTHHSSIAPTGTISLTYANNASNGIEPSFSHTYKRNIIKEGKKTKEQVTVYSAEALKYKEVFGEDADIPDTFTVADDVPPKSHVDMQAAAQKWVDSSISKTANIPTDFPYHEFKDIYMYAYEKGLKGCTTFRFNPEAFQGILVKNEDLETTQYSFKTEDGDEIVVNGNQRVFYDGEEHTAANLFDALKEGYYGKF